MKLREFNLEDAFYKTGSKVVTRNGIDVHQLQYYSKNENKCKLIGIVAGLLKTWYEDGTQSDLGDEFDLFVLDEKYYYNIYYNPNIKKISFESFDTEESALEDQISPYYLETRSIKIPE